jgi:chemotaxis protein MotD
MLLETQPDPAAEAAPARGDDRTPPQKTRCEPSTAAERTSGLTNSKPADPRRAHAIAAKESRADETDGVPTRDSVDPDGDDVELDVDMALLADLGAPTITAAIDPAASPETPANLPPSPAPPTTTPVAAVVPVNADLAAIPAAPPPSDSQATILSPTLTPAAPVAPAMATAADSQDMGAAVPPPAEPTATPDATHPAAPTATPTTVQAQSPEHSSASAQIPEFIAQATRAGKETAAVPASPAVPATPANPQTATAASPAVPATPANPVRAAPAESTDAQDAPPPPSVPPTNGGAANKPDDSAARPAAGDPVPSRLGRTAETAKTEAARPGIEHTGRTPEGPRPPGGANPVDQAPDPQASGTPTVSPDAAKAANGESKPVAPHQHDLHEVADTLTLQPGATETRPTGATLLAAGPDAAGTDLARSTGVSAATNPSVPPPGNAAATAPTNAPYAMASSAPVPISGLAVELVSRVRDGKNRFEIRLDPPELGRIDVHLKVDRDGNVTSRLIVERSETLDLLRRDAPSLERALHNAGLKTGEQGLEFSLRHQGFDRDQGGRNESGTSRLIIPDEVQPSGPATSGYGRRLGIGGGIDIRV